MRPNTSPTPYYKGRTNLGLILRVIIKELRKEERYLKFLETLKLRNNDKLSSVVNDGDVFILKRTESPSLSCHAPE